MKTAATDNQKENKTNLPESFIDPSNNQWY